VRSRQHEQCRIAMRAELPDSFLAVHHHLDDILGGAVAKSNPNDFGQMAKHEAALMKVRILRHDRLAVGFGVLPNVQVVGRRQAHIPNVRRTRDVRLEMCDQPMRHVLVEQQLHAFSPIKRRSRSAAKARQARISSRSRSGKSARISSSVMPEAKY